MLTLVIPGREFWDERREEFIYTNPQVLKLEHSLVSVSKWESKWKKAFMNSEKSAEEIIDYIRCMTLTQNVDPNVYYMITEENLKEVTDYIHDEYTATWFSKEEERKAGINNETITSELIYYWMITLQIPVEFQKWHLNRLITLIKVCSIKNTPAKKMNKRDIMNRNRSLNAQRKAAMHTHG